VHQPNPIVARNKPDAIHNSAHFPGPDGLGPTVAELGVVIFRWGVKGAGARVEKGLQSEEGPGHPEGYPAPEVHCYTDNTVYTISERSRDIFVEGTPAICEGSARVA
jgi:hypothetical protein